MKNEISYSFKQLLPIVTRVVQSGRTPFIWGPPGIGKSALGRAVADQLNARLYVLDAPLLQPTDYCIAVPDHTTKTVQLYTTGFLPTTGPAVVLVEDLPHAKPYQMVPLMQIVLDRRIGPVSFARDVHFILTGNNEEHLAYTSVIPSPLLNRVLHFNMRPDLEEWVIWAKSEELDERVYSFVNVNPQFFVELPSEGVRAWPTPRSWHSLSDTIRGLSDKEVYPFAIASVGTKVGTHFDAWIKYLREVDIVAILDKGVIPNITDRTKLFAIVQSVAHRVVERVKKRGATPQVIDNSIKYWKSLTGEYKILFLKELIVYKKDSVDTSVLERLVVSEPSINEFIKEVLK